MPMTKDDVLSICLQQLEAALGYASGDLSTERAEALDRYHGEPYGDEVEGRSQVCTRETMETVEMILPSLIRIFCDSDNMVKFDAVSADDEEQAELETAAVSRCYWKMNRGFYNTYAFCKDALLSKTGILKIWPDLSETEEREEYTGLNDLQLGELMHEPGVEREVLEYELTENGHDVTFKAVNKNVRVVIEPVPPEEFGVANNARSPYVEDTNFCYHRTQKTRSELIAMGFDADLIDEIPSDEVVTEERLARRNLADEWDYADTSLPTYWVTECYIKLDMNGDDIDELLKVTIGGDGIGSSTLLEVEEVDRMPFAAAAPVLMPHKFIGLSIADLVMDLQQIKTVITRNILDNTYLANNIRTAINTDYGNLDDILTSRPGGVVRTKGNLPWQQVVGAIPHNELPQATFGMLEYLDEMRKSRTGAGDDVAGLDKKDLGQVNTGVFALAYDQARMKIELIARILAEVGFKQVFRMIHELLLKHQTYPVSMKVKGQWQQINPSDWRKREHSTVMVGVGQVSRERRLMALEAIQGKQMEQIEKGGMGTVVLPQHVYKAHYDWTKAWGLQPDSYWQDPAKLPPPKPQQPSAQDTLMQAQAQALMMEGRTKMEQLALDKAKAQMEMQIKQQEWQYRAQENQTKLQIEALKGRLSAMKSTTEAQGKIASLEAEKERQLIETNIAGLHEQLAHVKAERDREVDIYKIQMDALSKQLISHGITYNPEDDERARQEKDADMAQSEQQRRMWGEVAASLTMLTERLSKMHEDMHMPKDVIRDAKGLMVQIGDKPVIRDASGRVTRVGG